MIEKDADRNSTGNCYFPVWQAICYPLHLVQSVYFLSKLTVKPLAMKVISDTHLRELASFRFLIFFVFSLVPLFNFFPPTTAFNLFRLLMILGSVASQMAIGSV